MYIKAVMFTLSFKYNFQIKSHFSKVLSQHQDVILISELIPCEPKHCGVRATVCRKIALLLPNGPWCYFIHNLLKIVFHFFFLKWEMKGMVRFQLSCLQALSLNFRNASLYLNIFIIFAFNIKMFITQQISMD